MKLDNRCDYCNRAFEDGDLATVIIPDIEVTNRYEKNNASVRLKLSMDAIITRAAKIYCSKCLNLNNHFLQD